MVVWGRRGCVRIWTLVGYRMEMLKKLKRLIEVEHSDS